MTNTTDKYFNIRYHKSSVILELDYMIFLENETYSHKEKLKTILDEIEKSREIDIVIISNNHTNFSLEKYKEKWDAFYKGAYWEDNILRVFRTYDELFIKIKSLKKAIVFMSNKTVNTMLFNFSMSADLRFISNDFVINNNNKNMVNIPKGGHILNKYIYKNPFKLIFLLKEIKPDTLYKRQLVDRVYSNNLEEKVLTIADHLATFDYIEMETIKILDHKRLNKIEHKLQKENEFLLSCIRTKINQ
ncbi:Clp protease/crotonase-like domain-containing protein [Lutibacter citreus]|uniref:enoyl-CoA hydratase/isomerase family protein n=1 Tax=Lutibacter citreus TaxID=2138210 RepID=UPI000DBE824F|nr:enoyl-CoA hydratase/isomerase family protein [Lutibacter citreus]